MKFEGQQVNIPIKGIMRAGTDNLAADGAMNEVIGLEYKDGSWVPYQVQSQDQNQYFHYDGIGGLVKTYVHKINKNTVETLYLDANRDLYLPLLGPQDGKKYFSTPLATTVRDVACVGNMLCVATDSGMKYFIYKDGVYTQWQTGFYPRVELRVTAGIYDASETINPQNTDEDLGISSVSRFLGEKLSYTDRANCLISKDTEQLNVMSAMTSALGEVRDRGGLTGFFVACPAYRLKNGSVVAAGAPVFLGRPLFQLGNREWNLNDNDGEVGGEVKTREDIDYYIRSGRGISLSIDRSEALCTPEGFKVIKKKSDGTSPNNIYCEGIKKIFIANGEFEGTDSVPSASENLWHDIDDETISLSYPLLPNLACVEYRDYWHLGMTTSEGRVRMDYYFEGMAAGNMLQYRIPNTTGLATERDIESVCIFMSQEINPYLLEKDIADFDDVIASGKRWYTYEDAQSHVAGETSITQDAKTYFAKTRAPKSIIEDLKKIGSLYLVEEVKVEDITPSNSWISIDLKGLLGATLATRESLPITAFDHNTYYPEHLAAYNMRLHAYDYSVEKFKGYDLYEFGHRGGDWQFPTNELSGSAYYKWEIFVNINDNNGATRVVNYNSEQHATIIGNFSPIITYPSNDAESITIRIYDYVTSSSTLRIWQRTFPLSHNWDLGISYFIAPDLKPIGLNFVQATSGYESLS